MAVHAGRCGRWQMGSSDFLTPKAAQQQLEAFDDTDTVMRTSTCARESSASGIITTPQNTRSLK